MMSSGRPPSAWCPASAPCCLRWQRWRSHRAAVSRRADLHLCIAFYRIRRWGGREQTCEFTAHGHACVAFAAAAAWRCCAWHTACMLNTIGRIRKMSTDFVKLKPFSLLSPHRLATSSLLSLSASGVCNPRQCETQRAANKLPLLPVAAWSCSGACRRLLIVAWAALHGLSAGGQPAGAGPSLPTLGGFGMACT